MQYLLVLCLALKEGSCMLLLSITLFAQVTKLYSETTKVSNSKDETCSWNNVLVWKLTNYVWNLTKLHFVKMFTEDASQFIFCKTWKSWGIFEYLITFAVFWCALWMIPYAHISICTHKYMYTCARPKNLM